MDNEKLKYEQQRVVVCTLTMFKNERDALRKSMRVNSRKMQDQIRWYVLQGLKQDGFM